MATAVTASFVRARSRIPRWVALGIVLVGCDATVAPEPDAGLAAIDAGCTTPAPLSYCWSNPIGAYCEDTSVPLVCVDGDWECPDHSSRDDECCRYVTGSRCTCDRYGFISCPPPPDAG